LVRGGEFVAGMVGEALWGIGRSRGRSTDWSNRRCVGGGVQHRRTRMVGARLRRNRRTAAGGVDPDVAVFCAERLGDAVIG
jgi:hypothetical protein